MSSPLARVAVIGAGLAGLACARAIASRGASVTVLDKGRAPGGRLSTRRVPPHTFDLGAQYFTARDESFAEQVRAWIDAGACAPWNARIVAATERGCAPRLVAPITRYVGTPDMSALARAMAAGLDVRAGHRVESVARDGPSLVLAGTVAPPGVTLGPAPSGGGDARGVVAPAPADLGRYDAVAICLPADQAAPLVAESSDELARLARDVVVLPCFALGFAVEGEDADALAALGFDGAFLGREGESSPSPLSWVARDSSKPGRPPGERWVLNASSHWSRSSFDSPEERVIDDMLEAFATSFGLRRPRPTASALRRWASARAEEPPTPIDSDDLVDPSARVGLAGDWTAGGRVEGAYLSGVALAERLLES